MARADKNNLHRSGMDEARQQRHEQPEVPGASGTDEDTSPHRSEIKAKKRFGKTEKHTSDDSSAP
jgi:hypothetical protein